MKLLLRARLLEEFNTVLENRGLPRVNWVIAVGEKKERPEGVPTNTREVMWDVYVTTSWGHLRYFEPLSDEPTWIDRATGAEFNGVKIYEFFNSGGAEWPSEYIAVVAPLHKEKEVRSVLEEFIEKNTPRD